MINHRVSQWRLLFISLTLTIAFFSSTVASAGPAPAPLEIQIDTAVHVVVGRITQMDNTEMRNGLQWATATITVEKLLKGPAVKQIKTRVVCGVSKNYGGSWAPSLRRIGNYGVWILGDASGHYGLLPIEKLEVVENILGALKWRKWTEPVNRLQAWAGVIGGALPVIAIRNVSENEIYFSANAIKAEAISKEGIQIRLKPNLSAPLGRLSGPIAPGTTKYFYDFGFLSQFRTADAGDYVITFSLEYQRPNNQTLDHRGRPVTPWQGKLTPPSFTMQKQ